MIYTKTLAIPPGETIREQLEYEHLTQKDLARLTGLSEKHISRLVNGRVILTPATAALLEKALGLSARFWLNLEAGYRADLLAVAEEEAAMKAAGLSPEEWAAKQLARADLDALQDAPEENHGRIHPAEA